MDHREMLDCILEWAESNPSFNSVVFEGIDEYYSDRGYFTDGQEMAIENVYYTPLNI